MCVCVCTKYKNNFLLFFFSFRFIFRFSRSIVWITHKPNEIDLRATLKVFKVIFVRDNSCRMLLVMIVVLATMVGGCCSVQTPTHTPKVLVLIFKMKIVFHINFHALYENAMISVCERARKDNTMQNGCDPQRGNDCKLSVFISDTQADLRFKTRREEQELYLYACILLLWRNEIAQTTIWISFKTKSKILANVSLFHSSVKWICFVFMCCTLIWWFIQT